MTDERNVGETLFVIMVDATAVSAPNYIHGDTHAMLAFTKANELDDAYIAIDSALREEGWSNILFGRVKDITGKVSSISDDIVREHAERAYTHTVSLLVYNPPHTASSVSASGGNGS